MVRGLSHGFLRVAPVHFQTGANWRTFEAREAGLRTSLSPVVSEPQNSAIFKLRQLTSRTGADWRKLAQQGGRCATCRGNPLKGFLPDKNWRSPPVRLLDWRNPLSRTTGARP
jgi:hypothetical protein